MSLLISENDWRVIMIELKIQSIGTGVGVELPSEVLKQLQATVGESIFLEYMADGSYALMKHDEEFAERAMLVDGQMHEEDS